MHRHKIKETAGHFYEEWHQKLHNNTTPDDIIICEALLAFLRSGNIGDYWGYLNKNGITKERLASYDRKIVTEPWMKKEAIPDFENYLQILK
jgi:alpha-glucan,water dikinase